MESQENKVQSEERQNKEPQKKRKESIKSSCSKKWC